MDRPIVRVVAGLIRFQGRWLVAQKKAGARNQGQWEFPGGKIEDGETAKTALEREILEELGLRVKASTILASTRMSEVEPEIELIGVLAESQTEEIELHEHQAARWCELKEIKALDLVKADQAFLNALEALVG